MVASGVHADERIELLQSILKLIITTTCHRAQYYKFKFFLIEEDIMKKLLSIAVVVMLTLGFAGCGNSPDGDGQKPTDGGAYGQMNKNYGPAGDGRGNRGG